MNLLETLVTELIKCIEGNSDGNPSHIPLRPRFQMLLQSYIDRGKLPNFSGMQPGDAVIETHSTREKLPVSNHYFPVAGKTFRIWIAENDKVLYLEALEELRITSFNRGLSDMKKLLTDCIAEMEEDEKYQAREDSHKNIGAGALQDEDED